ncbi:cell division protein FtsA [Paremcibacter congregatus]|uniref:cell division protein FtsA n=1 Tax=Paremcibacter congregatus TaxID=2043170 RepID=UPI0030EF6317|tara:strand:- start:1179 stop:2474 length:1296 start_codon:yes stop_codon:yes gene_type:complete
MREQTIAALDIGTSKICCFIARVSVDGAVAGENVDEISRPRVIGIGHQISKGLKAGTIVDMEETETSIRAAVDAAERMAGGSPIHDVYVNISAGQPTSRVFSVEVDVAGHEISQLDIDRVLAAGQENLKEEERFLLHSRPINFSIDGVPGAKKPLGMYGEKLGVEIHMSTVAISPLKNIQTCLNRCHLNLQGVVLTPYASALSALVPDERDLGSICVDMGGGITSIAAFRDNEFVFGDILPVGGNHVTRDIAQGLSVPEAKAERLKILYGDCLVERVPVREQIDIVQTGEDGRDHAMTIPRSMLTSIVNPRIEEILELVRDRIVECGLADSVGRRIVFTGGASQISGLEELARKIFSADVSPELRGDFHVRMGRPISIDGLADATAGPVFSTCAGLLNYGAALPGEVHYRNAEKPKPGFLTRAQSWLKANF